MYWLRLIRWPNLLIVLLTQLLVWLCIVMPVHDTQTSTHGAVFDFAALCGATLLIAAAGYVINDYFDTQIDALNRPGKLLIGKQIPHSTALLAYILLNVAALGLAVWPAVRQGHSLRAVMQAACIVLLWFYAAHFKRMFLLGNVVVALLTAFTIVIIACFRPTLYPFFHLPVHTGMAGVRINPVYGLGVYALFAFSLTWMREIVKDMEDYNGDAACGCLTMPIRWGVKKATAFILVLGTATVLLLVAALIVLFFAQAWWLCIYALLAIIVPLVRWLFVLPHSVATAHYRQMSLRLKWIMLGGIVSLIIYYFENA
jgi:4-hydroxybenzoate polyprenyltransferase